MHEGRDMSDHDSKMPAGFMNLLGARRLWPLTVTQACGAMNDNMVRNAMIVLALFKLGAGGAGLAAMAGALFMAPYILLSATAGELADRFARAQVIRVAKIAELGLMLAAGAAFVAGSVPGLLAVLCGLGVQAAVFGPLKYGILPDLLDEHELVAGNGVIEGTTFVAIVAGTIAGGALIMAPHGPAWVAGAGAAVAVLGAYAAWKIPVSPAADPALRISANIFATTWRVTRQACADRSIRFAILGVSWFWTLGATLLAELPVVARDVLHAQGYVLTLFLTMFALGVGAGSAMCAKMLKGEISTRHVPFAAFGMSVFLWDFAHASAHAGVLGLNTLPAIAASASGWRMLADLLLLAVCGGIFSVPLYTMMQELAQPSHRARIVAGNNVVNALFMVAGAAAAGGLAAAGWGSVPVLHLAALLNLSAVGLIILARPQDFWRGVLRAYFSLFHGVTVIGAENYRRAGDRVVIISNHLSFLDAALISAFLPQSPTFAIHSHQMRRWWVRLVSSPVNVFPVDIHNPYAIKRMVEAVRDHGAKMMIFPEGRITQTGALMKTFEGAGVIAHKAGARILPVNIDGPQFTPFGHMHGKLKLRWFPRLRITIFPSIALDLEQHGPLAPRRRRELAGRVLQEAMVSTAFDARDIEKSLFAATLDAAARYGAKTPIMEDINREPITYGRLILGACALGRALAEHTQAQERVGLMMPNANATLVAFLGLGAFNRVPAMLNFSTGAEGMLNACAAAQIRIVISSRAFVEKGKLSKVVERMEHDVRFIWLEDVRQSIGLAAKLRAKWDSARARHLPGATAGANTPAVVLFTSGSEGAPKGVVLSHRNILANCAQLAAVVDFNPADRVFTALPMFHSFGLVGGTLLPLFSGVRTFLYPSPLHYRIVPALIYDTDATICFGTDTFLNGWAKYAHAYDFYRMRYAFAGAEKVRESTKKLFAERFGVRILEGYGVTETSPVLAINTAMHSRAGSVGKFLPGIEHRLEPVPGIAEGGRLWVRGPNVMLGYMRTTAPGIIEPPEDGWYDTGDIVDIDADGYITITGRAKRFAKIAGEMVSMTAAESLVASLWPEDQHAVLAMPDARKGEQLLLLTTRADAAVQPLLAHARARGVAEIAVPRSIQVVEKIPLLGTGKIDYPAVQALAEARSLERAA
jgi:acyl-[acyl-carrier-protein]-phospholipid O-acyltransferase/long-chain-fatty-acid--[acyl-carrier-protein] ligase